jgi:hypothetical protein
MSLQVVQTKSYYSAAPDLANASGIIAYLDFPCTAQIQRVGLIAHATESACDLAVAFHSVSNTSNSLVVSPTSMAAGGCYYELPTSTFTITGGDALAINVTSNTNTVYTSPMTFFAEYIRLDEVEGNLTALSEV